MPSSEAHRAVAFALVLLSTSTFGTPSEAQQSPQVPEGFALERFYPSAPGGGWFVMDALETRGGPGGAMALNVGYARNPLRVTDGSQHVAVVTDQAFADFGVAATYDRWRLSLNLSMPLTTQGPSTTTVGAYEFHGPSVDLGSNPDTLSDARIGVDGRLLGDADTRFRLGASAQLFAPKGTRNVDGAVRHQDYDTDGTFRAMLRALAAGDVSRFTYAAQLGVHIRPLDDSPVPGSPEGSELLFGAAAGAKMPIRPGSKLNVIVGPEAYGATAFRSFLATTRTALEALLTGRLEDTADTGPQLRLKLGAGAGISQHFGAPEWRLVLAIEVFDHIRTARQEPSAVTVSSPDP